jgi:hypothetical protein
MKIRKIGFSSIKFTFPNVEIVTDPLITLEASGKFAKTEGDVVIITSPKYVGKYYVLEAEGFDKIVPNSEKSLLEIAGPGEYEVGGVIIRRSLGTDFYILDYGDIRTVYIGANSKGVRVDQFKNIGDVDVLIMPVGGVPEASYDEIDKIVKAIDPSRLILSGYNDGTVSGKYAELNDEKEFLKNSGYTHVSEESLLKISKGTDTENRVMDVYVLK